jgi:hypothetical protein
MGALSRGRLTGNWLSSMKSKLYSSSGSETGCWSSGLSRRPVVPTDDDPDELLVLGFALVWALVWMDDGYERGDFFICFVTTCRVWYVNPSCKLATTCVARRRCEYVGGR